MNTPGGHGPRFAASGGRAWLAAALFVAAAYGVVPLYQAFRSDYVVQVDARLHVFWMQRFVDSTLFPGDLIADYYQSISPIGYSWFYRLLALIGVNPLLAAKLLPIPLVLATVYFCFRATTAILPLPMAGFIAAVLLAQSMWMRQDMVSATSRAFLYPFLLALIYYVASRRWTAAFIASALLALFYPPMALVSAGTVGLQITRVDLRWRERVVAVVIAAATCLAIAPQALKGNDFGPVLTRAEGRTLPELQEMGRYEFFSDSFWREWLIGARGALLSNYEPPLMSFALLLPLLVAMRKRVPLAARVPGDVAVLIHLIVASVIVFAIAHLVLFRLYHPNRYTVHTFRIVLAIGSGVALTILSQPALGLQPERLAASRLPRFSGVALLPAITLLAVVAQIALPVGYGMYLNTGYMSGEDPALYDFLRRQPKVGPIASLTPNGTNIPSFTAQSMLVGREFELPWHVGFAREHRRRVMDLIQAQYSPNLGDVQVFIRTHRISWWLLDRTAFSPYHLVGNTWLERYDPARKDALRSVEEGVKPALADLVAPCARFESRFFIAVEAACVLAATSPS